MNRKQFVINPRFQFKFVGWLIVVEMSIVLVFYGANLHFFKKYVSLGKSIGLQENHAFFKFLMDQYQIMNWIFIGASGIALLVILVFGMLYSHRIAGPLYRLCNHMRDRRDEKLTQEFKFRPNDYFPEVAAAYNDHLKYVVEHFGKNKD